MCRKSECFETGKTVPSLGDKMLLHKISTFQDHPRQAYSPIIWTALALAVTVWHCTLNVQRKPQHRSRNPKKISPQSCCKRLFQSLLLLSIVSSAASTMTSQKTLYILKGDNLILECNLQDKLPKASIDWKFSDKPTKPLPAEP